jgi:hypothetical protein
MTRATAYLKKSPLKLQSLKGERVPTFDTSDRHNDPTTLSRAYLLAVYRTTSLTLNLVRPLEAAKESSVFSITTSVATVSISTLAHFFDLIPHYTAAIGIQYSFLDSFIPSFLHHDDTSYEHSPDIDDMFATPPALVVFYTKTQQRTTPSICVLSSLLQRWWRWRTRLVENDSSVTGTTTAK